MKNLLIKVLLAIGFLTWTSSLLSQCIDESQIAPSTICTQVLEPVCGCNGITYRNACHASRMGVTETTAGACSKEFYNENNPNEISLKVATGYQNLSFESGLATLSTVEDKGGLYLNSIDQNEGTFTSAITSDELMLENGPLRNSILNHSKIRFRTQNPIFVNHSTEFFTAGIADDGGSGYVKVNDAQGTKTELYPWGLSYSSQANLSSGELDFWDEMFILGDITLDGADGTIRVQDDIIVKDDLHVEDKLFISNEQSQGSDLWQIETGIDNLEFFRNSTKLAGISATNGAWLNYSDARLKGDIKKVDNSLHKVMQLNPSTFLYNSDSSETLNYGFIAQELQKIYPDVVSSDGEFLQVSYSSLIPILTKAIQEQQALIDKLNTRIDALESK